MREDAAVDPGALIADYRDLLDKLRAAVVFARKGEQAESQKQLALARDIVNLTEYLEPTAKTFMTAVFAEFHAAVQNSSNDAADIMFENYLQSMQFSHGTKHVVMGDCCCLIGANRAVKGCFDDAIEFNGRALVSRMTHLGYLHSSTAAGHFNLGLLYRLKGDLISSRKELRISRRILEALCGAMSLEVAKVDISLGQTERVACQLSAAFLHFYLAFHIRAMELGPEHPLTLRAYQLVCQTRFAYKDRLITSVELLDRMDELGFLSFQEEGGDLDAVMAHLMHEVYAIKTAMQATAKGLVPTTHAHVSTKYITIFGEYLVFRKSHLSGLIRSAVAQRIDERRHLRLEEPSDNGRLKYNLSVSFDNMSNLVTLTEEILMLLLPSVPSIDVQPVYAEGEKDFVEAKKSEVPPNLLTPEQNFFQAERFAKRQGTLQRKKDDGESSNSCIVTERPPSSNVTKQNKNNDIEGIDTIAVMNENRTVDFNGNEVPCQKKPDEMAPLPSKNIVQIPSEATSIPKANVVGFAPRTGSTVTKAKSPSTDKITKVQKESISVPASSSSPSPSKKTIQPMASFMQVKEDYSNKAFFRSPYIQSPRKSGKELKAVLLPSTGQRELVISTNAAGETVTIRRTLPSDILEALKVKIFTLGIFPYLLLNDYRNIEKEEREFTTSNAVARKRAESEATEEPELFEPNESIIQLDTTAVTHASTSYSSEPDLKAPDSQGIDSLPETDTSLSSSLSGKPIPIPPPLPTAWPPQVENGVNVGGNGPAVGTIGLPPAVGGVGGAMSGLFGVLKENGEKGVLKRKSGAPMKPVGPKRKQLHWEMLDKVDGTIWTDVKDKDNVDELFAEEEDIFSECADMFAAAVLKNSKDKNSSSKNADLNKSKNKNVAILDGQKSQNMNIMLAKFGSRRKVSEVIHAIISLQCSSFTLSTVSTMLDYTPASFADSGEVDAIRAIVAKEGTDKLGKAETYLYELAKIPNVDDYLRVLVLLLSIDELKENLVDNAAAVIRVNEEVRGSVRLKVFFRAALQVGNILNEGTKKSGAIAFKISSLSKLTQTKSNSGKTVMQYLASTLDQEMPGILELRKDLGSLEAAKHVSFPSLQLDISKVETGVKILSRLKGNMKKKLDEVAEQMKTDDSGPDSEPEDEPPEEDIMNEENGDNGCLQKKKDDHIVTQEIYDSLLVHEQRVLELKASMCEQQALALTCHSELCTYLGEDEKTEPEAIYGTLISFVNAVGLAAAKRR